MKYEGSWNNGLKEGKGKENYPNGGKYEGDFKMVRWKAKELQYYLDLLTIQEISKMDMSMGLGLEY